ncbi:MAG: CvpA family protein [Clostridia bacterium]|nr:CvpA family protein [Clostridia bacterium]
MNIIDLCIIAVLGIGFLLGWYKGFLVTALNFASHVLSWVIAVFTYPALAELISQKTNFNNTLLYFTAGVEKLSDMSVANVDINVLGAERIQEIISTSKLPAPIENMMLDNILNNAFASQGISTLSDYFNQTIINISISLISFLIIFFAVKLICTFAIGLVDYIVKLPVLKQFDKVIGGGVGVLQAAVFVWVVFAIIPIVMSVRPMDDLNTLIQGSLLGRMFFNGNVIFSVLKAAF